MTPTLVAKRSGSPAPRRLNYFEIFDLEGRRLGGRYARSEDEAIRYFMDYQHSGL